MVIRERFPNTGPYYCSWDDLKAARLHSSRMWPVNSRVSLACRTGRFVPHNFLERGSRAMSEETSTFRLYLMRLLYLGNFVGLGFSVWPGIINHEGAWDPVSGVAFCFWAALSALSGLGLRYPLKMLPLLLLQLLYKSIWLIAVWLPLTSAGQSTGLTKVMVIGLVADLIVIPWPYVLANYVTKRGDRWR